MHESTGVRTRIRDPLYCDILRALDGDLDEDLFELCAIDLVRAVFPGASPVAGGSDGGMDGAIPDPEVGEPFPLVSTTSRRPADMVANLQRSLRSYVKRTGKSRRAVFATPRKLTPQSREKLRDTARAEEFSLENSYGADWFAQRLHEHPFWRRELLGLSGTTAALSKIPRGYRPSPPTPLVARPKELERLRDASGDFIVLGQPGSGKTRLLMELLEDGALFLASGDDFGKLADEIRAERPRIIIVDDAIISADFGIEFLERLRHMRSEIDAKFRIVASSWPGARDAIKSGLALKEEQILELELLTRDEIVEVIRGIGLEEPAELVRRIVDQAEGRPGLATTLAQLALRQNIDEVVTGEALTAELYPKLSRLIGEDAKLILATLAMGGRAGFDGRRAAELLGMSFITFQDRLSKLAASGVIREASTSAPRYVVSPEPLRYHLVRDVFFRGPRMLAWADVVEAAPDRKEATVALIGAHARGAIVPDLFDRVQAANTVDVWCAYISVGAHTAELALSRRPDLPEKVLHVALRFVPKVAVAELLKRSGNDSATTAQRSLIELENWIQDIHDRHFTLIERRQILIDAACEHCHGLGPTALGMKAALLALRPDAKGDECDPGAGMTVTLTRGHLGADDLRVMLGLWPQALAYMRKVDHVPWPTIFDLLRHWRHSTNIGVESSGSRKAREGFLGQALVDVAALSSGRPAVRQKLNEIAKAIGLDFILDVDPDFVALFLSRKPRRTSEEYQRLVDTSVRSFLERHQHEGAAEVVDRLVALEVEAESIEIHSLSLLPYAARSLADRTNEALEWIELLVARNASGELVRPFLERGVRDNVDGWKPVVRGLLALQRYGQITTGVLLTSKNIPQSMLDRALAAAAQYPDLIEHACFCRDIPKSTLRQLLAHEDASLVTAAVEGHWEGRRRSSGTVEVDVSDIWSDAVLRLKAKGHWFAEILTEDCKLAIKWIFRRCTRDEHLSHEEREALGKVVPLLHKADRRKLIAELSVSRCLDGLLALLVERDPALYQEVLTRDALRDYHLNVLVGRPTALWATLALLALEAGYTFEDVTHSAFRAVHSWTGNASVYWHGWVSDFAALSEHEDTRLQTVAQLGENIAKERVRDEEKRERHEAIFGRR